MTPRQFWLAIHRYLGLATLVFLGLAALTGCALEFRSPLDAALNPDLFHRAEAAAPLDPIAAATAFQAREPGVEVLSFPLHIGPHDNLPVSVGPRAGAGPIGFDQVFLDSDDGHVAGRRLTAPGWDRRHFVQGIYIFHYTLLAGVWGRWLMGVVALGWLIGAGVGLYLTLPSRGPFWKNWAKMWTLKLSGRLPRVLLELHQSTGLWLLIPVLVLAWTSVSMNFFDEAFTPAVQALSPAKPSPFDPGAAPRPPDAGPIVGYARAVAAAEAEAKARGLTWRSAAIAWNSGLDLYGVSFTNDGLVNYSRLGPITYFVDGRTTRFVYQDSPYQDSAGRAVSRSLYPLHTGKVAGPVGMTFIFILGLVTLEQCVTGAYLWLKRRGPRIASKRAAALRAREAV